jgi:hypothetical protein
MLHGREGNVSHYPLGVELNDFRRTIRGIGHMQMVDAWITCGFQNTRIEFVVCY